MGSSYATLLADLRLLLRESAASTWTDAQLAGALSNGEIWLASYLAHIRNSKRFEYEEEFTVTGDTETYDMTGLTKADGSAGDLLAIRWISMQNVNTWQPVYTISEGDENLARQPSSFRPSPSYIPGYDVRDDDLIFLPTSPEARTFRISYNWVPIRKGTGGTAETPKRYDDILTRRAAYDSLGEIGQSETTFEDKYATRLMEITKFESNRWNKGQPETVKNISSRTLFPY